MFRLRQAIPYRTPVTGGVSLELVKNDAPTLLRSFMPELDTIRGVAILSVVLYHAFFWSNQSANLSNPARLFVLATQPGWLGVDLFFVLSGFLISGLLIDSRQTPVGKFFKSFYARRALRILPLYYVVLLIASIFLALSNEITFGFFSLSLVYLSNVAMAGGFWAGYPLAVLWSLAVEEQFYLIWPAITKLLTTKQLLWLSVGLCVGEPLLRALSFVEWGYVDKGIFYLTWFRLDSFAWGTLMAIAVRHSGLTRKRFWQLCLILIALSLVMTLAGYPYGIATRGRTLGAALQSTCSGMFFAGALGVALIIGTSRKSWLVNIGPIAYLGRISYCLYLVHQLCFWFWDRLLTVPKTFAEILARAFVVLSVAILISELSRRYFEARFLQLKSRFAV